MSGYVFGLCYEVQFGDATLKAVAVALADHASHDGSKVFPSIGLISRKIELSERTVQRALRKLEALGVLRVVRAGGSGPGNTREWAFDVDLLRAVAAGTRQLVMEANKGDTMTPFEDELRVTLTTAKGDTDDVKGDTGDTQTKITKKEPIAPLPPNGTELAQSGQSISIGLNRAVVPRIEVTPRDVSWAAWIEHLAANAPDLATQAQAVGALIVAKRWPSAEAPMPTIGRAA